MIQSFHLILLLKLFAGHCLVHCKYGEALE